jgi:hypothetical protein
MKSKNLIILISLLIAIIVAGIFVYYRFFSSITVHDEKVTYNISPLNIAITYPQIQGLDDFNQKAKAIIDKEFNDFKTNSLANDASVKEVDPISYAKYPREYELDIGYDKGEIDENIVSVVFSIYNFEGGAHGASYFVPLNYNPKTKQDIKLSDLFLGQADYLQKISDFCIADLTKQLTKALGSLDGTYLKDGAGPNADNFQYFLINPNNTITFYFPQYQVAYGAAGDFKVVYPR